MAVQNGLAEQRSRAPWHRDRVRGLRRQVLLRRWRRSLIPRAGRLACPIGRLILTIERALDITEFQLQQLRQ